MKKTTAILTLSIALGILFSSTVQAINPMNYSDISFEKELVVQDWMLGIEASAVTTQQTSEDEIRLESWMLNGSWNDNTSEILSESEIQLEDWMTRSFNEGNLVFAQNGPLM